MKNHRMIMSLLAVALGSCAIPTGEVELNSTTASSPLMAMQVGEQPVLPQLDQITFELVTTESIQMDFPGGEELSAVEIVYYENQIFYAYVWAINPNVSNGQYFAVSTDGVEWVVDPQPIEFPLANTKDNVNLSRLEPMADGTWRLITTQSTISSNGMGVDQEIWAMTAGSLEGPWMLEDQPLLAAGEEGSWDQSGVRFSAFFMDDERYYMLYISSSLSFQGLAVSDDGIAWRRTLPEGITGPYPDDGNLVFMELYDGIWFPLLVWRTPTGWQMI